jgi:ribosome maturation factor RimP
VAVVERVRELIEPLLAPQGVEVIDLEFTGGALKLTIDRDGGVNMDAIAEATRTVSRALDEADPVPGHYTLEVSSPGLERSLRTPPHFQRAIGLVVAIKTFSGVEGERRVKGELVSADDSGIVVRPDDGGAPRPLSYDQIERARTVFEWGPGPKPGKSTAAGKPKTDKKAKAS